MTLDEALTRPAAADEIVTITCHIGVIWANDQVVLTTSEESFFQGGERIPVRDGAWIGKRMSSRPCLIGGPLRHFYACEITGRLHHEHGTSEVTDVSRCVIRGEELDDFDHPVLFELILDRNEPAS